MGAARICVKDLQGEARRRTAARGLDGVPLTWHVRCPDPPGAQGHALRAAAQQDRNVILPPTTSRPNGHLLHQLLHSTSRRTACTHAGQTRTAEGATLGMRTLSFITGGHVFALRGHGASGNSPRTTLAARTRDRWRSAPAAPAPQPTPQTTRSPLRQQQARRQIGVSFAALRPAMKPKVTARPIVPPAP